MRACGSRRSTRSASSARPPLADDAAERLIKALDHYDPAIRAAAARVIGRLEVKRAGDALIKAINDSNPAVRFASMRALGDIRDERAVQALTEQLTFYGKGEGALVGARRARPDRARLERAALQEPARRQGSVHAPRRGRGTGAPRRPLELPAIQAAASTEPSPMVARGDDVRAGEVRAELPGAARRLLRLGPNGARRCRDICWRLGPSSLPALTPRLKEPDAGVRAGVAEVIGALGTSDSIAAAGASDQGSRSRVAETAAVAIERIKMRQ